MVENTIISEMAAVLDNLRLEITVVLFFAAIITLIIYYLKIGRRKQKRKVVKKVSKREDEEKIAMVAKIEELQKENVDLRERLQGLELKQMEDVNDFSKKREEIEQKSAEVNEGLGEILAIKEALNHHRMRVGQLEKEKKVLFNEMSELKANNKNEIAALKKEFDAEKESLKNDLEDERKKQEEGEGKIKEKAKETIMRHEEERAALITKLERENKKLKQAVQKMKEKLGIWEPIEDI